MSLKILKNVKNPKVLLVTPLLTGHEIERDLKIKISRNDIPFDWIQYEGIFNTAMNTDLGLKEYLNTTKKEPKYFMKLDRDIIPGRHMIDKLSDTLDNASNIVAYSYCGFSYKGDLNADFPITPFNPEKLLQSNYISSMSLFKMSAIKEIGLVTDEKYKRLLDWCLLIKLLSKGYIGQPCYNTSFIAISQKDDISAGSQDDYKTKYLRVYEDFIKPLFGSFV